MRKSDIDPKLYSYYVARNLDELMGYKMYQTAGKVEDFLSEFEDELPYETYEVFYDWGWDGWKDGYDLVCFYKKGPGYLHENWSECSRYNKAYFSELTPAEKKKYGEYLEGKSEENRLKRMAKHNEGVIQKIGEINEKKRIRNLSICPLTPDPPEVIELIAELREYLKTVECDYIGTYDAYFSFDYAGTTYKMDHSALSAAPDQLFTARVQIFERLEKFGAGNITYTDMWD